MATTPSRLSAWPSGVSAADGATLGRMTAVLANRLRVQVCVLSSVFSLCIIAVTPLLRMHDHQLTCNALRVCRVALRTWLHRTATHRRLTAWTRSRWR
jgi:hypothetical protein